MPNCILGVGGAANFNQSLANADTWLPQSASKSPAQTGDGRLGVIGAGIDVFKRPFGESSKGGAMMVRIMKRIDVTVSRRLLKLVNGN